MEQSLIKDKKRVQQHGEVFTPDWIIEKMLAIPEINQKLQDIDATFLEPSAGEGYFLVAILDKKLSYIHGKRNWESRALRVLASIYAIELLHDNVTEAREKMLQVLQQHYFKVFHKKASNRTHFYKSACTILKANIVEGNTLTRKSSEGQDIVFSQWQIVDDKENTVKRIPFTYASLFGDDLITDELRYYQSGQLSLFEDENDTEEKVYKVVPITKVFEEESVNENNDSNNEAD